MKQETLDKTLALIKQQHFRYFITTRFLIIFSLFMQSTCISYLMYSITKNPLSLGLIGLAELIPALSLAIFAGYWVDRMEKKKVYFYCLLFYVLNALLMFVVSSGWYMDISGTRWVEWSIYILMFMNGSIRAFLAPASFSLMPSLVKNKELLPQAITWSSTSWLLGSVLGPLAGGLFMASIGANNTILIAVFLIGLAAFLLSRVPTQAHSAPTQSNMIEGIREGFHFIFRSPVIIGVIALDLFAVLFGGAEALLPIFSKEILNIGELGYGWLRSAHGIGSICLLLLLTYLPLRKQVGQKLMLSIAGFGVCIILFGISKSFAFSFAVLFLAGMFDGVSVVIRHSILQLKTPEHLKGRVSSINMMFISSSNELGAFESGLAARLLGTVPSVVFGGIMTILIVVFTYLRVPALRRVKLSE